MPKKIAFFLGAGASKAYGVPVTAELLPRVMDRIYRYVLFDDQLKRNDLKNFLLKMMPQLGVYTKYNRDGLPLITDILSMCDYMILNNTDPFSMGKKKNLLYFRKLLIDAILEVLDVVKYSTVDRKVLRDFTSLIYNNRQRGEHANEISLISTNYDCQLEYELFNNLEKWTYIGDFTHTDARIDFGVSWRSPFENVVFQIPTPAAYNIYKLHGSTNWLKCPVCGFIFINPYTDIYILEEEDGSDSECYCSKTRLRSHIVAPSLVRDIRDANLLNIWRHATEKLREADEWVIVGYSLPPEDIAIKTMLIRAFNARKVKPDVTVIQYEKKLVINPRAASATRNNYELYFKTPENTFKYHYKGLAERIPALTRSMNG